MWMIAVNVSFIFSWFPAVVGFDDCRVVDFDDCRVMNFDDCRVVDFDDCRKFKLRCVKCWVVVYCWAMYGCTIGWLL